VSNFQLQYVYKQDGREAITGPVITFTVCITQVYMTLSYSVVRLVFMLKSVRQSFVEQNPFVLSASLLTF
jgi:hypothetical protein